MNWFISKYFVRLFRLPWWKMHSLMVHLFIVTPNNSYSPRLPLLFLSHAEKRVDKKRIKHVSACWVTQMKARTQTHALLSVGQFKSANTVTWKPLSQVPVMQLTPSTGSLLPWQRAAGWPISMWVKNPFPSGDIQKHQLVLLCMYGWMLGSKWDLMSERANLLCISLHLSMTKLTASKGWDWPCVIDMSPLTHSHTQSQTSVPPNNCIHYLTSGLWLYVGMWRHERRTVSCSFSISVDELMWGE